VVSATILAENCYENIFYYCTSLETAPVLPATLLKNNCYSYMFHLCDNLSSITVHFTEWNPNTATNMWVNDVADSGEFHCPAELLDNDPPIDSDFGTGKIPKDSSHKWTVITDVVEP